MAPTPMKASLWFAAAVLAATPATAALAQNTLYEQTFDGDNFPLGTDLTLDGSGFYNFRYIDAEVFPEQFEVTQNGVDGSRGATLTYDSTFAAFDQGGSSFWGGGFGHPFPTDPGDGFDDSFSTTNFDEIFSTVDLMPVGLDPALSDLPYTFDLFIRSVAGGANDIQLRWTGTIANDGNPQWVTVGGAFSDATIEAGDMSTLPASPAEFLFQIELLDGGNNWGFDTGNGYHIDNYQLYESFASGTVEGDYDDGGQVEQTDLDFVLSNWGDTDVSDVTAWINYPGGNAFDGLVDQNELDGVLLNWGSTSAPDFSGSAVPEPASLALVGLGGLLARRRR